MSDPKTFKVKVRDTENVLFEQEIDRISSFNEVGPFDVYPMHANFISIVRRGIRFYLKHQMVKEMAFEQAVMKVKSDMAQVFLGIEVLFVDDQAPTASPAPGKKK
ncbi:MAG TPA: hypothetical protein VG965_00530 [Patescibacteria group bacterium]|nr:hypothetical protein [Patescibacteria group bacterium]